MTRKDKEEEIKKQFEGVKERKIIKALEEEIKKIIMCSY